VAGVRLAERWLRTGDADVQAAMVKLLADPDWEVREQLAASLGEMPEAAKVPAIAGLLEKNATDPVVVDAALSGVAGDEARVLDRMMRDVDETPARTAAITMLAATLVRGAQDGAVLSLFDAMGKATVAPWQRSALLGGAEVVLLDRPPPGSLPRRDVGRGGEGCPTCPGARSGPGGAAAFPAAHDADNASNGGRGGRGRRPPVLMLSREPSLVAVASAPSDPLADRARAVLARIGWPGKAGGVTTAVAPLSPSEQARFAAGREIYQNLCAACHQPNGRGQERVAPPLVGSELALSAPGVPIRILLNGKEGPIGLMPPLGYTLTDDQIADVLTYIRREWGQAESTVDPADVARTRSSTSGRTKPWTNDELVKVAGGG
jgi:mono/diheme cytochrome c family protein